MGYQLNGIGVAIQLIWLSNLHNADVTKKYKYQLVALDDECKPNIGIQVATKAAADLVFSAL